MPEILNYECQHEGCHRKYNENEDIMSNNGKCIFHCNKNETVWFTLNEDGTKSWKTDKVDFFWERIRSYIRKVNSTKNKIPAPEIPYPNAVILDNKYYIFKDFIFPKVDITNSGANRTQGNFFTNSMFIFSRSVDFSNATFLDTADFQGIHFQEYATFYKTKFFSEVNFFQAQFDKPFLFNKITYDKNRKINFHQAVFNDKVQIQNCEFKTEISFLNTKFKKLADFENTQFKKVNFERTDFAGITIFTNTSFKKDIDFKFTKFLDTVIFREAKFLKKLNLQDSIRDGELNFLKINEDKELDVKNRETARIIKDSFEQQNNIIEANRFYALEMKERENELTWKYDLLEKFVFKLHGVSSNYSQNWIFPLSLIFIIGFIAAIIEFPFLDKTGVKLLKVIHPKHKFIKT